MESLVPVVVLTSGVGGSVLGVFDAGSGDPLVPLAQDPALFGRDRFAWGGEEWVTVERRLIDPPLHLVMAGPTGAFREPFEDAARGGLITLLVVGGVVALLTTILTRRFTAPLQDLSEAAHRVAAGDLSRGATEGGPPEVARTARAFNAMTRSLQRSIQRLSQQEAAAAVGEGTRRGQLARGFAADIVLASIVDWRELPYWYGVNLVTAVWVCGVSCYSSLNPLNSPS